MTVVTIWCAAALRSKVAVYTPARPPPKCRLASPAPNRTSTSRSRAVLSVFRESNSMVRSSLWERAKNRHRAPCGGQGAFWQDAEMTTERMEVERMITPDAAAIFRVLSDPQGLVTIDSSGMLMD